jgi:hypothetical protein
MTHRHNKPNTDSSEIGNQLSINRKTKVVDRNCSSPMATLGAKRRVCYRVILFLVVVWQGEKRLKVCVAYPKVDFQNKPAHMQGCIPQGDWLALTIYQVTTESQGSRTSIRKQALSTWNPMGESYADARFAWHTCPRRFVVNRQAAKPSTEVIPFRKETNFKGNNCLPKPASRPVSVT